MSRGNLYEGISFELSCWNIVMVNRIVIFNLMCLLDLGGSIKFKKIMDDISEYGMINLRM